MRLSLQNKRRRSVEGGLLSVRLLSDDDRPICVDKTRQLPRFQLEKSANSRRKVSHPG